MSLDYHDASFAANCETDYCSGKDQNYADTLKIVIHYPKHSYDVTCGSLTSKLPAYIYVHGGTYSDCSNVHLSEINCIQMAKKGFVCFNVEYRRGREKDGIINPSPYTSVFQVQATYRAAQDIRGAIRYLIYRQNHHSDLFSSDPYQIDTSKIFLGGTSAGAVTVLSAAYLYQSSGQSKINDVFPIAITGVKVSDVMGNINIDFYKGDDTYDYMQHVKGLASEWGGAYIPTDKVSNPSSFFSGIPHKVPVIAFHGIQDLTFNYFGQLAWLSEPQAIR